MNETTEPLNGYSKEQIFYVYLHKRSDGSVFYVGKGKEKRAFCKKDRNPHWRKVVKKNGGFDVEILHRNLDEQTAFTKEVETIALYGIENLTNMTLGGISTTGMRHTVETRKLQSEIMHERLKNNPELFETINKRMEALQATQDHEFRLRAITKANEAVRNMTPEQHSEYVKSKTEWLKDPVKVANATAKAIIKRNTPEFKKAASDKFKEIWNRPDYRESKAKQSAERWLNPEFKAMLREIRSTKLIVNREVLFDCIVDFENQINNRTIISSALKTNVDRGLIGYVYKGLLLEYYDETVHSDCKLSTDVRNILGDVVVNIKQSLVDELGKVYLSYLEFAKSTTAEEPAKAIDWISARTRKNLPVFGRTVRFATLSEINAEILRRIRIKDESNG